MYIFKHVFICFVGLLASGWAVFTTVQFVSRAHWSLYTYRFLHILTNHCLYLLCLISWYLYPIFLTTIKHYIFTWISCLSHKHSQPLVNVCFSLFSKFNQYYKIGRFFHIWKRPKRYGSKVRLKSWVCGGNIKIYNVCVRQWNKV